MQYKADSPRTLRRSFSFSMKYKSKSTRQPFEVPFSTAPESQCRMPGFQMRRQAPPYAASLRVSRAFGAILRYPMTSLASPILVGTEYDL
jgi:hypothetical protein